ncbi:hypothetical protein [Ammoniphilus sp. CFH 90114]|uniref:hypothetical protein n=1 Tax=Ammoniphilus sp. CFH 90114 TaxID=2493665 RepID=UPI0013E94D05|nr:hypothetical protein [Ammoniphilus sp. CFH 90114]
MAKLQSNKPENQFDGLPKLILIFFVILMFPILYFVFNMILGNEHLFIINGAK